LARLARHNVLIWGDEDRFLPLGTREAWFRDFPGSVIRLPQVAHMAQIERPARIAAIIRDQLQLPSVFA
ncbi:MAG: hypothetical protein H7338_04585, partial [Candidatus Sericytochromatia bacterium]|nr:hypothetical protein [Candidatus Sericytochromatia bacterium]